MIISNLKKKIAGLTTKTAAGARKTVPIADHLTMLHTAAKKAEAEVDAIPEKEELLQAHLQASKEKFKDKMEAFRQ
jgi:arginine/ornithine N-succinyltransferase beta subunit